MKEEAAGGGNTMMRITGAVALVFALGAGAMTMLGAWLGGSAEAAALGLVGAGLVGTSYMLGGRPQTAVPRPRAAAREEQTVF